MKRGKILKVAVVLTLLMLVTSAIPTIAQSEPQKSNDPHTKLRGTMTTIYKFGDGYLTITEIFTGEDLQRIYGDKEIVYTEKIKINRNLTGVRVKREYKEIYVIRRDEKDKIGMLSSYPYPQWTYKYNGLYYIQSDPIDLAWEGTTESYVKNWLNNKGWTWACGTTQYVWDDGTFKPQNHQLEDPGSDCFDSEEEGGRIHLRLWQLSNGDVVGGAHHEYWDWGHHVISFEPAEDRVDDDFHNSPTWDVDEDSTWLNNFVLYPYNNGYATVITKQ